MLNRGLCGTLRLAALRDGVQDHLLLQDLARRSEPLASAIVSSLVTTVTPETVHFPRTGTAEYHVARGRLLHTLDDLQFKADCAGMSFSRLAIGTDRTGSLHLFGIDRATSQLFMRCWVPETGWWSTWNRNFGEGLTFSAIASGIGHDGTLHVFGIDGGGKVRVK